MGGWITALAGREEWSDERTTLIHGDAVRVMEQMPDNSVDLVLADPPYSSGGQFRGDRMGSTETKYLDRGRAVDFDGDNRDQRGYFAWSTLWMGEAARVLAPGRAMAVFTDWRQLPTTTDAVQAAGFVWRGILVWDKGGGRPSPGISNGQVEYVVWGTRGPLDLGAWVSLPGLMRARVPRGAREQHQTPKPTELLARLCELAPPEGVVFDPFTGSGSALIAARAAGRRAYGVELNPTHVATARERLDAEQLALI